MTKIIVACNQCQHQYSLHEKRVGENFSCFCGNLLRVPSVKIHDAAVVRCSSCGAARGKDKEPFCRYCASSFTLHERDLTTICPHCMTRISSKAHFCHSCATAIVAETDDFIETSMSCPVCDDTKLHSRKMPRDAFNVKECDQCAGLWLNADVFRHLENKAQKEAASDIQGQPQKYDYGRNPTSTPEKFYKKCPQCNIVMHRKNYAKASGIVVDVCAKHGIWFDIHELDAILKFIRQGLLLKHQEKTARKAKVDAKRAQAASLEKNKHSYSSRYELRENINIFSEIIDWLMY
ncbi:MAG: zf-TFIIB domain-containing protein [Proteobacteria bacterium]|nr:zf-TFIIB domain-containing protein [Pseudomonadota bacterium]